MMFKLAVRSVARNRWRSVLSAGGIAVGVAILILMGGFIGGFANVMLSGATALEIGHGQVQNVTYADEPSIYATVPADEAALQAVATAPGVTASTPRVILNGLLGNERRSVVTSFRGVDAINEPTVSPVVDGLVDGRWLSDLAPPYPAAREVVIGDGVARQLEVEVGAELVVFLSAADGSLGNDLLVVVGIVHTGSTAIDRGGAYMHLSDAQYIGALEGRAHMITYTTADISDSGWVADGIAERVQVDEVAVRDWKELVPDMARMLDTMGSSMFILYFFIYMIVALGVVNAARMSALERTREFGILLAVGLLPRQLGLMLVLETVLLGVAGALVGVALGGGLNHYLSVAGLDIASFSTTGNSLTFMGVGFPDRVLFGTGASILLTPFYVVLGVAALCGLWPAWLAMKIVPVSAIAGRT